MKPLRVYCCICSTQFDWYPGSSIMVCSTECYKEFDWRRTLAIRNKDYYPDPKGETSDE